MDLFDPCQSDMGLSISFRSVETYFLLIFEGKKKTRGAEMQPLSGLQAEYKMVFFLLLVVRFLASTTLPSAPLHFVPPTSH
jgi:hypothetical protein